MSASWRITSLAPLKIISNNLMSTALQWTETCGPQLRETWSSGKSCTACCHAKQSEFIVMRIVKNTTPLYLCIINAITCSLPRPHYMNSHPHLLTCSVYTYSKQFSDTFVNQISESLQFYFSLPLLPPQRVIENDTPRCLNQDLPLFVTDI
jgi:hypothetical protein